MSLEIDYILAMPLAYFIATRYLKKAKPHWFGHDDDFWTVWLLVVFWPILTVIVIFEEIDNQ